MNRSPNFSRLPAFVRGGRRCGSAVAAGIIALSTLLAEARADVAMPPPLEVEQYTLDNGLTVLLSHDDRLPVVAVEVRYLVGSGHERPGRTGFAHLFEHLMFQGSGSYDGEYFKPFEPIGGAVNGTTNQDRTNYYVRLPSNYLELALWMESDRMATLLDVLTEEKLTNQRDVVLNERRQNYEDRPYGMVSLYIHERLFPKTHPYGHSTIGSPEDLKAATLDDVKAFFRQYYVPANAVLTLVGDFDREPTRALIERYFGSLPGGTRAETPRAEIPSIDGIVSIDETDAVKLPRIHLVWPAPAFLTPGDAAMDAMASVLTDGKTSRLYKPLVYEQQIAKDVSAYQASMRLASFFVIQATAAPGRTVEALSQALNEALVTALETPPTEDEMARTLNGWRKSFYGRVESVLSRAQLLSSYLHFTGTPDFLIRDLERYTSLTASTVHDEARKWISVDKHLRIVIRPEAAVPAKGETP